ncbi:MAG: Fe-S protein assembly co-chaperone HscB [Thiohalomonadales bacterium]|nr:Fe-S protein assembly co-chaperone HscB [Thiohalomonadales bacterium]
MALTQNHFELFGIPVAFDIDAHQLAERYRELQRALHPDRYANASDRERRLSIQHAAQVNEAFQTLKSSLRRARYLLQLKGIDFDDEKETHLDPTFLMEQMELREALADVRTGSDPLASLGNIMADIKTRQQLMETQLRDLFIKDSEEAHQQAKQLVQKMQFLVRLQQEAEELEEELVAAM